MRGKNRTKSLLIFLLTSLMIFTLAGCGSSSDDQNQSTTQQQQGGNTQTVTEETEPEEVEQTGSAVADSGAGQTGETENYYPYTYDELTDVAKKEQNDNPLTHGSYELKSAPYIILPPIALFFNISYLPSSYEALSSGISRP